MKPVKGDTVQFWLTVQGKPKLFTGLLEGYNAYNGRAVVRVNDFTHYVKPNKITIVPNQEELEL